MSRHDFHRVADDNPKRANLWCLDCECFVHRDDYRSPYKHGEAPYVFWHDVTPEDVPPNRTT